MLQQKLDMTQREITNILIVKQATIATSLIQAINLEIYQDHLGKTSWCEDKELNIIIQ